MHGDAVAALLDALGDVGLQARRTRRADIEVTGPDGPILVDVEGTSVVDAERARRRRDAAGAEQPTLPDGERITVIVGDLIGEDAREVLRRTDLGYLDRRGSLWLRRGGLFVNAAVTPLGRQRARHDNPIRGRVALGVALCKLIRPDADESVRQLASAVGAAASTVHEALTNLRDAALLDGSGRPLVPELFEAAASVWRPERIPVARRPESGARELEQDDVWVVGADVGAAAAGAPIVVGVDPTPDFYVRSAGQLRRALRVLGEVAYDDREATVSVAPSPVVIDTSIEPGSHGAPWLPWPIAHPVVLALDLADDRSRGREIIDDWHPEGVPRAW